MSSVFEGKEIIPSQKVQIVSSITSSNNVRWQRSSVLVGNKNGGSSSRRRDLFSRSGTSRAELQYIDLANLSILGNAFRLNRKSDRLETLLSEICIGA